MRYTVWMSGKDENKIIMTFDEYANDHTMKYVSQIFVKLREDEMTFGPSCKNALMGAFITNFVASVVLDTLVNAGVEVIPKKVKNKDAKDVQYEITKEALSATKVKIQEAVADGFSVAMGEFSGKVVDYYCVVKALPEPVSRKLS